METRNCVLWVDEDFDDFPSVHRIVRKMGVRLKTTLTIQEAFLILKENEGIPLAVILDAIVPWGEMDKPEKTSRYPGVYFLLERQSLVERAVVFSIVPRHMLLSEGLPENVRTFSKLRDEDFLAFRKHLEKLINGK